ncbi:hypothetical protein HP570_09515 [Brevibacillus sp. RS1.1]|uniref:hypothetical protein n=1 Tax=Brevibacillus sp. RS1.1 TaxID=2738982 RepID=UPI00156B65C5|nr:hypothetical protein [Brevibacillus sp. RS1.1]NRR02457.1 hypothetical protein [Brevibacillus sp. RS1.1]
MKPLSLAKEIREGKLEDIELVKSLDIHHNMVQTSAIIQIVSRKLCNEQIVDKLTYISQFRDPKVNKLFGTDTLGHFSMAALKVLDTIESKKRYDELTSNLDEWDKEIVERLATGMFN